MNDDENFIIEKVTTLLDPRKTGAIPRNMDYSSQYLPSFYWDVVEMINNGLRVCVILRGLPGSGKSFLGKKIIQDTINDNEAEHIISADDYFMINGRYQYDSSKIPMAHDSAQRLFFSRASKGFSPLIIDNTNMKSWEMFPYIQAAIQYKYHLEIMEPSTPWKWSTSKLALKNKHSVSSDKIKKMKDNYERVNASVKDFVKNTLNLDIVKEPLLRNYPPFRPKPALLQSSSDTFDVNKNRKSTNSADDNREPLSWQKFNSDFQKHSTNNYFMWDKPKQSQEDFNNWNPPPQIFEDKWDQPNEKEITIKEKEKPDMTEEKPQPQRTQRKTKPSSPPSDSPELKPHRRNCPNENQNFAQLREMYPNINEHLLWDFFEKCKGDVEWCADMLCDEILTEQMDTGEDLTCNCSNSDDDDSWIPRKFNDNNNTASNNKKQTPIKAKKSKSNTEELLAAKMAIEENVRIGHEFYPEHVNKVKVWKGISPRVPQSIQGPSSDQQMMTTNAEEDTLVALTIDEGIITELCELFGGGKEFTKELMDQNRNFKSKMFIKSSTALQLYKEILETFYSHQEEAKFKEIENDRSYAIMLHEQEKAYKYPQLVQDGTDSFKDIMDTQAALKEYHDEVGWQKIEKTETMAEKLSKEKLYRAFSSVDKATINEIFEAQDKDFKKTIEIIQDSLGYTDEMRKQVSNEIEKTVKFNKQPSAAAAEEDEFTQEEYACIKKVEELQEQFDQHSEEQMRCIQKSREHIAKKEYHTASYYSSMVNLHKQLCEEKRQQLMNILAFSFLNNASSSRLDLHYFTQEGAKTRLHTFLDAHIAKLREIKKQFIELEIVTGRGAHSLNGPVLKNMTIKLFQGRGLKYFESNPGLLKVKVYPNSMLYEEKQRSMKGEN